MLNPKLAVGEAYMDGGLVSFGGSIHDVLDVVLANLRTNRKGPFVAWLRRAVVRVWRPINQFNARARARRNVAHQQAAHARSATAKPLPCGAGSSSRLFRCPLQTILR
jgi:hypothetical protein